MRKSERIEPILNEIEKYWKKNPDLRLGQIIANCVRAFDGRVNCDPFYIEDDDLITALHILDGITNQLKYCEELNCILPISPVYNIELVDEEVTYLNSKVGGEYFWPDDNPPNMQFLAQINLSELPEKSLTGILQFFIGDDDCYGLFDNNSKVVYHKDITQGKGFIGNYTDSPILKPCAIKFTRSTEFMSHNDYRFVKYKDDIFSVIDDGELYHKFSGAGHKLFGYPFFTQYDPREVHETKEKYDTLLFQLDSDNGYIEWGDYGVANFFINSEDLKNMDFSDVLYNWDCY